MPLMGLRCELENFSVRGLDARRVRIGRVPRLIRLRVVSTPAIGIKHAGFCAGIAEPRR